MSTYVFSYLLLMSGLLPLIWLLTENSHPHLTCYAAPPVSHVVKIQGNWWMYLMLLTFLLVVHPWATAELHPVTYETTSPRRHSFFDRENLQLQGVNVVSETLSLLAIHAHDTGVQMSPCSKTKVPCDWSDARGRTLDPFEKHFQSYGYGWGAVYDYGAGVGANMLLAYALHATGHHKMERWIPVVGIVHAGASTGYALTGSAQGKNGW